MNKSNHKRRRYYVSVLLPDNMTVETGARLIDAGIATTTAFPSHGTRVDWRRYPKRAIAAGGQAHGQ